MTTEAGDPMGTTTTTYADAVRKALDDLPAARYLELVDGLDEHLAEVHAEADGTLADVLGPPEAYAAELRASAGLPPRAGTGAPLPPPVAPAPAAARPARRPIDRGLLARIALGAAGALVLLWVLGMEELPTLKLAFIVVGVTAAMWLARRLLSAARLADRTARRVSLGIAVGGLVVATAFGSIVSERWKFNPVYNGPPVTMLPDQGTFALPEFRGMSGLDAAQQARELLLDVVLDGVGESQTPSSVVVAQDPPPNTLVARGSQIRLVLVPGDASVTTATVPVPTTVYLGPSTVPSTAATTAPSTTVAVTLPPVTTTSAAAPTTSVTPTTAPPTTVATTTSATSAPA